MLGTPAACKEGFLALGSSQASGGVCVCGGGDKGTSDRSTRYKVPEVRYQTPREIREESCFQLCSNCMEDFLEEGASEAGRQNMQDWGRLPEKRGWEPSSLDGAAFLPPVPGSSLLLSFWFDPLSSSLSLPSPLSPSPFPLPFSSQYSFFFFLLLVLCFLLSLLSVLILLFLLLLLLFIFLLLPPLPFFFFPPPFSPRLSHDN